MQRAAHEPRDDHRALVGERRVDVGRTHGGAAGAQGQPRRAQVLGLHRQQPPDDLRDPRHARAVQELRRRPVATERMRVACHHS